jgi:NADPH-dependent 2,4-dienoyl-CoA reductase/sulfur reductase-like enzyme/rhodanese-related sulfurtransferase
MQTSTKKRILIVGGVAGGASCATRARRLCEQCEIVIFDKGPYVSFANCGLPYYVGNVIQAEEKLLVATPDLFRERFNIQVRLEHEVIGIDRTRRTIDVRDNRTGTVTTEAYDALVLSTGAEALRPDIPGIDLPGIFVLRTIPDSRKIRSAVEHAKRALIVGGGMIGLEMAENLIHRGLDVTLVELAEQILPVLDPEMAVYVSRHLEEKGVQLLLGQRVTSFSRAAEGPIAVTTSAGETMDTDIVILGLGVRPNSGLARAAGLELGPRDAIVVDEFMHTSDPHIWAVGDAVASEDIITHVRQPVPLAGPANRQGRIAAASVLRSLGDPACLRRPPMQFRGIQSTAVCGVFDLTVAATGASEQALIRAGITDYEKVYLHPGSHASYFPNAKTIHLKLLFSAREGRILGAQAVGEADVARRIDVIAMALQMRGTVFDLEEAELCYAPQYGGAKDPVNLAGMIAANHLRGDLPLADWEALGSADALILDVRSAGEFAQSHIPGSVNIPLEELRTRTDELPRDRPCWLVCGVGQRAYYASRALLQRGFDVRILSGGMRTYRTFESLRGR